MVNRVIQEDEMERIITCISGEGGDDGDDGDDEKKEKKRRGRERSLFSD